MSRCMVRQVTHRQVYICERCARPRLASPPLRRGIHSSQAQKRNQDSVLGLLEERGYINQIAGDRNALDRILRNKRVGFYAGIDPTAPSLHLGHLLPVMVLFWLSLHGYPVISLVGGGTARVGDPSGRLASRAKTADDVQKFRFEAMYEQTGNLWKNAMRYAGRHGYNEGEHKLLDNGEWLDSLNVLDFLKTLGNGMRLGTMLGRDTVKNKMEKGDGMSFSEFTYPLLQGWDWWHMYRHLGVQVQVGGADQYGNIIAGMDAVKYIATNSVDPGDRGRLFDADGSFKSELTPFGLTVPLLTTSSGEKFGKSAGNAVWLDRKMTTPFDLYGFLLRSSDADVERYLKLFTFTSIEDITALMQEHNTDPGKRKAQHLLAREVLELVHGREEADETQADHQAMRNPTLASLANSEQADPATKAEQRTRLPRSLVSQAPLSRVLWHAGLASSKAEGRRLISKGGLYIASATDRSANSLGFVKIVDEAQICDPKMLEDDVLILRIGKWRVSVVEVVEDAVFESKEGEELGLDESSEAGVVKRKV